MQNNEETYKYVLYKSSTDTASFFFIDHSELPSRGFCSLYRISAQDTAALSQAGVTSYSGFQGTVWSPQLVIDCDSEEAAMETERALRTFGLAFEVWATGNRGRHFYIDRPHAPSHKLPQIDKEWVLANIPSADMGLYSHLHLLRVPGMAHKKTGKLKCLLYKVEGAPLILAAAPEKVDTGEHKYVNNTESVFEDAVIMALTRPHENGMRHKALLDVGLALLRKGEPLEFVSRWLFNMNALYNEPKNKEEIERLVDYLAGVDIEET